MTNLPSKLYPLLKPSVLRTRLFQPGVRTISELTFFFIIPTLPIHSESKGFLMLITGAFELLTNRDSLSCTFV